MDAPYRCAIMFLTPYLFKSEQWTASFAASRDRILTGIGRLGAGLTTPIREELGKILEIVNSYYSNAMEGNPTRVGQIFDAKEGKLAATTTERNYQLEHMAHLHASETLRRRLQENPSLSPTNPSFLQDLHREFYSALPESMRTATMGSGKKIAIIPGQWRTLAATVGRFKAASPDKIHPCMEELAQAYDPMRLDARDALTALAASHHRFLWVHPFPDGNGRVVRLFTEAMAIRLDFAGHHLYSISRGLARRRRDYDETLGAADAPRWNDLDGRGNLSLKGLIGFCDFFLDVMSDQIDFMTKMLEPEALASRLSHQLHAWEAGGRISSSEAKILLHLFKIGEIRRGDIKSIAGLERRQVSRVAAHLLSLGLVGTSSPKGPLRLLLHHDLARALLPEFFE
jgi:Fic family protein